MEGAGACRVQATGMAAMTTALLCQLSAGDHIVAAKAAFGSCRWLVDHLCPRFGIEATVVDGRANDAWEKAIRPNTQVFRSEERRVGNGCVRTVRFCGSALQLKKKI